MCCDCIQTLLSKCVYCNLILRADGMLIWPLAGSALATFHVPSDVHPLPQPPTHLAACYKCCDYLLLSHDTVHSTAVFQSSYKVVQVLMMQTYILAIVVRKP